jgi:hypothetical protein
LPVIDVLINTISASEAHFTYTNSYDRLAENYVPFVTSTGAWEWHLRRSQKTFLCCGSRQAKHAHHQQPRIIPKIGMS